MARGFDVLIVDTAGRLHTQTHLMRELEKIHRVVGRKIPGAPHEVLLVLDATTGQNAIRQAEVFTKSIDCTGIVLTKLDGTAKGGVVVAIQQKLGPAGQVRRRRRGARRPAAVRPRRLRRVALRLSRAGRTRGRRRTTRGPWRIFGRRARDTDRGPRGGGRGGSAG